MQPSKRALVPASGVVLGTCAGAILGAGAVLGFGAGLAALLACTPARTGSETPGPLPATAEGGPSSSSAVDSGAIKLCVHGAKDVAPCLEDCDHGIATACALVAARMERGDGVPRDLTRAVRLHERACELRDVASCVSAARMHSSGSGVPPSRAKQIELLEKACMLGDGVACGIAARAFDKGTGVVRDEARATELWRRACIAGAVGACEDPDGPP